MLPMVIQRFNELFGQNLTSEQVEPADDQQSYLYWGHEKIKAMYRPDFRYTELLDLATREIRALCLSGDPYLDLEYALRAHRGFTKVIAWRFCSDVSPGQELAIPIVEL